MAARPPGNEAHETIMPLPRNSTQHHSLAMMHQIKYPARNHPPVSSNTTLLRRPRFSGGDRQKLTGCQYSLQPDASHNARREDPCWPRQDGCDQNHQQAKIRREPSPTVTQSCSTGVTEASPKRCGTAFPVNTTTEASARCQQL